MYNQNDVITIGYLEDEDTPPEGVVLENETTATESESLFSWEAADIELRASSDAKTSFRHVDFGLEKPRSSDLNALRASLDVSCNAQEPWPKDVKLYQPYEVEQILLPDNANCLAVQAFLRICGLEFQIVSKANAEFMSPTGKVPFIKCGAFIVSELDAIVQFVNNKGISLTSQMESDQKADMRAYISLIHNCLENAELYLCWIDLETYNQVTKPRNGSVYPWPLSYIQTTSKKNKICKRLKVMGWYDKTLEEVFQEIENCCQALSDRLDNKDYFYGKSYTELDALLYGHVYSILKMLLPASNTRLFFLIRKYKSLIAHCKRLHFRIMQIPANVPGSYTSYNATEIGDSLFNDDVFPMHHEVLESKLVLNVHEALLKY